MTDAAIQRLIDIEDLKTFKHRYGQLVDRCAQEGMAAAQPLSEMFTDDCVLDFTAVFKRVLRGPADVRDQFGVVSHNAREFMWHAFTNPIIEIDGDKAKAYWCLEAISSTKEDPQVYGATTYGRYYDELVRTPQGWKQSRMLVVNETRTGVSVKQVQAAE